MLSRLLRRDTTMQRARSSGSVARDSLNSVEVRVVTDNILDRLVLHRGENEGIVGQQPMQLAECGCQGRQMPVDRQDFDP